LRGGVVVSLAGLAYTIGLSAVASPL